MTPGSRGQAMALAAFAIHALSAWPVRLTWCVDMERDVGSDADRLVDPSNPLKTETVWGTYLQRFRNALNAQAHGPFRCGIAMMVRSRTASTGKLVLLTYHIPWYVNLCGLAKAQPPVGCWRLLFTPQGHGPPFKDDTIPDSYWYDGIPF